MFEDLSPSQIIQQISHNLPKFEDGRINYTYTNTSPILSCFIEFEGKVLLLKRSEEVLAYQNMWCAIAGFIDRDLPLEDLIQIEISEETQIPLNCLDCIEVATHYTLYDEAIGRTWIVFPALAKLNSMPKINLSEEHTEYIWINPEELHSYAHVPNLDKTLRYALSTY